MRETKSYLSSVFTMDFTTKILFLEERIYVSLPAGGAYSWSQQAYFEHLPGEEKTKTDSVLWGS